MRFLFFVMGSMLLLTSSVYAAVCPHPQTSALQIGKIPPPWEKNPFSPRNPQADESTRFVRANILVAGRMGRGVTCTYENSVGFFSILWQVSVKVPYLHDEWREVLGGYECSESLDSCIFFPGSS